MKVDTRLLNYFPDESIIKLLNGVSYMICKEGSDSFLVSLTSFCIKPLKSLKEPYINLSLSFNEFSNFLETWYSKNSLLAFSLKSPVPVEETPWVSEKIYLGEAEISRGGLRGIIKEKCLIRSRGYHSLSYLEDGITPSIAYFNEKSEVSVVSRFSRLVSISVPSEKQIQSFNKKIYG
jgi:hypothetical protein